MRIKQISARLLGISFVVLIAGLIHVFFATTPVFADDRTTMVDAISACQKANIGANGTIGSCATGYSTGSCATMTTDAAKAVCQQGLAQYTKDHPPTNNQQQQQQQQQQPTNNTPQQQSASPSADGDKDNEITCAIEKMGWILCPLIETSGKIGDQAFNYLASNFLQTEPELLANPADGAKLSGTKLVWEMARNLANIMFIIAFLLIILSQVTNQGISNYGVKKLLPKLIVAAVAVNVSYYICQLIVDVTNILGFEIQRFMVNAASEISDKAAMPVQTGIADNQTSGGTLGAIAGGVLIIPTAIWFLLPMLFLGVSTVVITCIVIIIILLMRKAFIVLLVVASPIAFVMYILPNTEKIFSKWLRMFWQLLLVFPIVGLLFGGGQLASAIVLVAGSSGKAYNDFQTAGGKCIQLPPSKTIDPKAELQDSNVGQTANPAATAQVKDCNVDGQSTPFLLGLVAAGIAVAPLIAVWAVLKGALSAAGAIGGKISGAIQNVGNKAGRIAGVPEAAAKKALQKRMTQNASAAWQRSQARGLAGEGGRFDRFAGRLGEGSARHEERIGASKSELARIKRARIDELLTSNAHGEILGGLTDAGQARAIQGAEAAQDKVREQETQAAQVQLQNMLRDTMGNGIGETDKIGDALEHAIINGDRAGVRAATNLLMAMGGPGKDRIRNAMATHGTSTTQGAQDFRYHITASHSSLKASDADVYAAASDSDARGLAHFSGQASTFIGLNDDELSRQSSSALGTAGASAAIGQTVTIVDQQGKANTVTRGTAILSGPAGNNIKGTNRNRFG